MCALPSFYIPKSLPKRPYLGNVVLQLVVLFNIEACPFHPLVKEQQILSVSGIWVNVLLQVTETQKDRQAPLSNILHVLSSSLVTLLTNIPCSQRPSK